jgi:UMF1 family MFS transporter
MTRPTELGPATRREILSWCFFDFANSSYTTMIITFSFALYFVETVVPGAGKSQETGKLLWGIGAAISQWIVVLSAPLVGALADFSGAKKRFLLLSYLGCVLGTGLLALVGPGDVALGMVLFIASCVCYSAGENLIAAFLPEIAPPERMGRISGAGWALGYIGGLASLAVCFPFLRAGVGPEQASSVQASFLVVAAFFLLGGLPTFLFLRERAVPQPLPPGRTYFGIGLQRVLETLRRVRRYRQLFRFLCVFLVYASGINVVVAFATIFAKQEMGMGMTELLVFFLVLQISASVGALAFGVLQDRLSSRTAVILSLVLWLAVCLGAYWTRSTGVFYVIGNLAGLAMGASQSAARALVGTFSPVARSGEFFGFWGLFWKLAGGGPLVFGAVQLWLGSRNAILVTAGFFVLGIVGMCFIDEAEGRRAAREAPAAPPPGS